MRLPVIANFINTIDESLSFNDFYQMYVIQIQDILLQHEVNKLLKQQINSLDIAMAVDNYIADWE